MRPLRISPEINQALDMMKTPADFVGLARAALDQAGLSVAEQEQVEALLRRFGALEMDAERPNA